MAGRVAPYIDNTGLVFAYDQSNTVRSYLGEPTTNIMPYNQEFTSWGSNAVTLTPNAAYAPDGTLTATLLKADGTASYHYIYQYLSTDSSATYTFSCYVKPAGGFNGNTNTFFMQTNDGSWKNTTFNLSSLTPSIDGWYRVSWTVSIATGGSLFWSIYSSPAPSAETAGGGYYIWGAQLEKKSHMTQYLPTGASTATRSATQGLKDLTGRSTIDLSNVSFDSNAQMTFDGTDDYVSPGSFNLLTMGASTLEAVIYMENLSSPDDSYSIFGGVSNEGYHGYHEIRNSGSGYKMTHWTATNGWKYANTALSAQTWYHVVWVWNGLNLTWYLNGQNDGSFTFTTFSPYGLGFNRISSFPNERYMNGRIPFTRVYNRALSDQEILQNFNAVRGRYGI